MTGQQMVLISLTFLTGLLVGMYLYVAYFAPTYTQTGVDEADFELIGNSYGRCENEEGCASFRLTDNRELAYLPPSRTGVDVSVLTTVISRSSYRSIYNRISTADLDALAEPIFGVECISSSGGDDYTYTIMVEGSTYVLDTCETGLAFDEEMQELLRGVFDTAASEVSASVFDTNGSATVSDSATAFLRSYFAQ